MLACSSDAGAEEVKGRGGAGDAEAHAGMGERGLRAWRSGGCKRGPVEGRRLGGAVNTGRGWEHMRGEGGDACATEDQGCGRGARDSRPGIQARSYIARWENLSFV